MTLAKSRTHPPQFQLKPAVNGTNYAQSDLNALFHTMPTPCAMLDPNGRLIKLNAALLTLVPTRDQPSAIDQFLALFEFADSPPPFRPQNEDWENMPLFVGRHRLTRRNYRFHYSLIFAADVPRGYWLCLCEMPHDQEELFRQREAHERLLTTARAQSAGEMTTILSHELNQPLGAIVNYLDAAQKMLSHGTNVPPRAQDALRLAQSQAVQAAAVVTRMREFVSSRQVKLETCAIHDVIARTLELLQWDLQQICVHPSLVIDEALPPVAIDSVMIGQVFTNLVRNALHAMRDVPVADRVLRISAIIDLDQRVAVRVQDSGAGISSDDQLKLFTPFFTTKPSGMGVGLAMCRSILELHAGSLYLEHSDARGSTFCFTLPTQQGL